MPKTPAKKTKSVFGNGPEIHSPIANSLRFEEDSQSKMVVKTEAGVRNKFISEYEIISKLGEGVLRRSIYGEITCWLVDLRYKEGKAKVHWH